MVPKVVPKASSLDQLGSDEDRAGRFGLTKRVRAVGHQVEGSVLRCRQEQTREPSPTTPYILLRLRERTLKYSPSKNNATERPAHPAL